MDIEIGVLDDPESLDNAAFTGYVPEQPATRFWDYARLCVPLKNRLEDATQDLERFTNCIGEVLSFLTVQIDHWIDAFDLDVCTDADIDRVLYDLGNPFDWSELDLSTTQRRKLARVLVDIYRKKGTAQGIQDVVLFLLGELVTVVPYSATGWRLGVDALGEGNIARVASDARETFSFTAMPSRLEVMIDGTAAYFDFVADDFVAPAAATAAEVAAALNTPARWLAAADPLHPALPNLPGAYEEASGSPARALATSLEPYAIAGGDELVLTVGSDAVTVHFRDSDFDAPGAATAAEVAARIAADCAVCSAGATGGAVWVESRHTGIDARIEATGGSALTALGWTAGDSWVGDDASGVVLYSGTAGIGASIEVTGGAANDALEFTSDAISGTGTAILGISESRALYSFDIETARVLSSAQVAIVRRVADYMKPAHTHLINVRTAPSLPWPVGWVLGVDALDESTDLGD